jgi:hypothetical protein
MGGGLAARPDIGEAIKPHPWLDQEVNYAAAQTYRLG